MSEVISEIDADKAKKMGLKSKGFGNWVDPKSGERYTTKGGKLHKVETPPSKGDREEPEAGAQAKDDVGGPAHPDAPEKKPSKPKIAKPMDNPYDVDKPKDDDKGAQSGHPAMDEVNWDQEIDPYDMWGVYEDLKDELTGERKERVVDYMHEYEGLISNGEYEEGAKYQKLIKKNLDMQFAPEEKPKPKKQSGGEASYEPISNMDSYYAKTAVEKNVGKKEFKAMSYGERQKAYADEFEKQGFEKRDGKWVKKTGKGSKSLRYGESIKEGKLNEAKETIFDVAARVMKDKQNQNYKSKVGMVKVDMQSANLLTKVWKKVNPKMKKILSDLGEKNPAQLVQTLWAVVK